MQRYGRHWLGTDRELTGKEKIDWRRKVAWEVMEGCEAYFGWTIVAVAKRRVFG